MTDYEKKKINDPREQNDDLVDFYTNQKVDNTDDVRVMHEINKASTEDDTESKDDVIGN